MSSKHLLMRYDTTYVNHTYTDYILKQKKMKYTNKAETKKSTSCFFIKF
jgi:hypothetical protein